MITLPSLRDMDRCVPMRIYLYLTPADMRWGFDTLAQIVQQTMQADLVGAKIISAGQTRTSAKWACIH